MELLALGKPIKKPPCSDERDGELFCGTLPSDLVGKSTIVMARSGYAPIFPTYGITMIQVQNLGQESVYITSPSGEVLVNIPRLTTRTEQVDVTNYDYINYDTSYSFAITILA